jgi:hypothetical protein
LAAILIASRLCHQGILWEGDSLPLAAARQMLFGKTIFRDVWYDKPPLVAVFHLLCGARAGWPLRLIDAGYAWMVCWAAWLFARDLWGERESLWVASLAAFFLIFDFPATAIPAASDLLLVAPHIFAVWFAWKRMPVWCGLALGLGFWISPKALFVAVVCALWNLPGLMAMLASFTAALGLGAAWLWAAGALGAYWTEVWQWGQVYAASPFVSDPVRNGIVRTAAWLGFHVALVAGTGIFLWRAEKQRWRWIAWLVFALAGVSAGMRFFPRYYFLVLPPLLLMAARGFALLGRKAIWATLLLAIPAVRFAPDYVRALDERPWRDTAMDRDSRAAAALVRGLAKPGDALFVWGYRPELFVYTGLPAATMYLDSQQLTGVPADRHLTQSTPIDWPSAAERRAGIAKSSPAFIIDGLSLFNPQLPIARYPELRGWLAGYREAARTPDTIIYQRDRPLQ